uniref:THAP domain-containing protein 1 n=1 Tax=Neogobius melanostomus TaxID=47308 RepID=A0A8C6UVN0_9GOBI
MTFACVVRGCDNKAKKYSVVMFHRFPNDDKRRQVWLAALNMDPTTPVEVLKKWRVCSEHFTEEDYYYALSTLRLKDTFVFWGFTTKSPFYAFADSRLGGNT